MRGRGGDQGARGRSSPCCRKRLLKLIGCFALRCDLLVIVVAITIAIGVVGCGGGSVHPRASSARTTGSGAQPQINATISDPSDTNAAASQLSRILDAVFAPRFPSFNASCQYDAPSGWFDGSQRYDCDISYQDSSGERVTGRWLNRVMTDGKVIPFGTYDTNDTSIWVEVPNASSTQSTAQALATDTNSFFPQGHALCSYERGSGWAYPAKYSCMSALSPPYVYTVTPDDTAGGIPEQ